MILKSSLKEDTLQFSNIYLLQSDIHWVKLPADQVTYELQPQVEGCHRDDFLIGIAAEVFHNEQVISSGIHWSSCIYLRNQSMSFFLCV